MRSQAVQREMPRPTDVNSNILRVVGASDPALTELQKVCLTELLIPFSRFFSTFLRDFHIAKKKMFGFEYSENIEIYMYIGQMHLERLP